MSKVDPPLHVALACNGCGKHAPHRCGVGIPGLTLVLCEFPVCGGPEGLPGRWCQGHRHRAGSMGYPVLRGKAEFRGFVPDGSSPLEWLKVLWKRLFWSAARTAQHVWEREQLMHPPPGPLPQSFTLVVGGQKFRSFGQRMLEVPYDNTDGEPQQ